MIVVSYLSSINIILGKYWIKHKTALNYKLSFFYAFNMAPRKFNIIQRVRLLFYRKILI